MIYTDKCSKENINIIKSQLNTDILLRLDIDKWNINEAISIVTLPKIELAIFNSIDELTVIEMGLLAFMCKPILITCKSINNFKQLKNKIVNYIDFSCNLTLPNNNFINWYRKWKLNEIIS